MSNHAVPATADGQTGRLAAALGRWSADPLLAPLAAPGGAGLLVLDGSGERILHASAGAAALRAGLADAAGRLHAALGLAAQIRRLGPLSGKPRIARLRLDPRGLAAGTPCQIARASLEDGSAALLIAPLTAPRPARASNGAARIEPAPEPPAESQREPIEEPEHPGRLLWRSDSEGVLTHVSGAGPGIAAALLGRSWHTLCARAAPAGAQAFLDALRDRRTFRGLPLSVPLPSTSRAISLDISGAPSGRANGAAAGFAGFAVIRGHALVAEPDAGQEPAAAPNGAAGPSARPPGEQPREPDDPETDRRVVRAPEAPSNSAAPNERPPLAVAAPDLSTDEHAAFREIARALGARFAGDARRAPLTADLPPSLAAASSAAKAADRARTVETLAAAFERLPAGILVHRDGDALFANRRLLDLLDHDDLQALGRSGSLSPLMAGAAEAEPVTVTTGAGDSLRLAADRSSLDWDGRPASLVLARPMPEAAPEPPITVPAPNVEPDPQALLDRSEDGIVTLDADGHVLRLNPRAEAILAEAAPQVVGKRLANLLGQQRRAANDAGEYRAPTFAVDQADEAAVPASEGSATPLRVRIGRLLSNEDSPRYATLQDMADAERAEEEAAARHGAEDARRRLAFFAEAGEAVRGRLSGILGSADAVLAEKFGPLGSERYRDDLRDIHTASGLALEQLNDLVALAEIEAGRLDLAFADLPLNDLVARCIAELQPQAARRRIVLRTSLAEDLQALHADERSLRNAAIKVLGNAIRLTESGGQVIVSTTLADAGDIALRVRDTGSGMSPEQVDDALDPFRQPRLPGAQGDDGAGLGLTLTKALVEANRGRLRVTSRKDEGTLVEMLFPARAASA